MFSLLFRLTMPKHRNILFMLYIAVSYRASHAVFVKVKPNDIGIISYMNIQSMLLYVLPAIQ